MAAISGGPDSVALLLALKELGNKCSLSLAALHVNHQLRGEESDLDATFVKELCQHLKIPLQISRQPLGSGEGRNLQDQARKLRYDVLFQSAAQNRSIVATGHTLQDQAETFLLKVIRGSGTTGLSGIFPVQSNHLGKVAVHVVRPLLERNQEEILNFLARRNQDYRSDSSNQNLQYDRNWVRHQLIPSLRSRLNPALVRTLGQTAGLFQELKAYLEEEGRKGFRSCQDFRWSRTGEIWLKIDVLHKLPLPIQKEVIRHSFRICKGDLLDLCLEHVNQVLALAFRQSGKQIHLPGGLRASREFTYLKLTGRVSPIHFSYDLLIPGKVTIPETGRHVVVHRVKAPEKETNRILLRFSGSRLTVRSRLNGDRYPDPSGKKLKRIFLQHRIPRSVRDTLVVLETNGRLLWVEGLPTDPQIQARPGEKDVVHIQVHDKA